MPLKCIDGGKEIYAFDYESDGDWAELRKKNSDLEHLSMPCCGAGVTLKTSSLGTRHFAHARRGECASAPESAEHLLAKAAIVEGMEGVEFTSEQMAGQYAFEAARDSGWPVDGVAISAHLDILAAAGAEFDHAVAAVHGLALVGGDD